MVLVLVVVVIWDLSSELRTGDSMLDFSEFIRWVETNQITDVRLTGNEIEGITTGGEQFRTYAPSQYEGLANKLLEHNIVVQAREAAASPCPIQWAESLI